MFTFKKLSQNEQRSSGRNLPLILFQVVLQTGVIILHYQEQAHVPPVAIRIKPSGQSIRVELHGILDIGDEIREDGMHLHDVRMGRQSFLSTLEILGPFSNSVRSEEESGRQRFSKIGEEQVTAEKSIFAP